VELGLGHGIAADTHGDGSSGCRSVTAGRTQFLPGVAKTDGKCAGRGGATYDLDLTRFPIVSEATVYFALVWIAHVLWGLFGHHFAATVETA
jgi:hypothetical protein